MFQVRGDVDLDAIARQSPAEVRQWADDLWLFPYYVDRKFVPYDARPGGPASAAWPNERSKD